LIVFHRVTSVCSTQKVRHCGWTMLKRHATNGSDIHIGIQAVIVLVQGNCDIGRDFLPVVFRPQDSGNRPVVMDWGSGRGKKNRGQGRGLIALSDGDLRNAFRS
jgi:hypothetical protein